MKKEYFSFNLNHSVLVKLTESGFNHWLQMSNKHLPDNLKVTVETLKSKEKNGYVNFQLWDFMAVFGNAIHMGMNPYFDLNVKFLKTDMI